MEEPICQPLIEPSFYDLVVVGTGLPESILAAGASAIGKSVLHLDPNGFYGSHFSSLSLHPFIQFLETQQNIPSQLPEHPTVIATSSPSDDYSSFSIKSRRLYSEIEICTFAPEALEPSRSFSLDLSGPRVLLCADPMVDLMLKSGASHHIEFKSIDGNFIYIDGRLSPVPDSREAIFKDRNLGLTEKSQLMRFFKLVHEHFSSSEGDGQEGRRISEDDLESPFYKFLRKQRLPAKIKSIILYAIAMADYDQESPEDCKKLLRTKDGIEGLALYHASVGRFPNALGAFIYPIYGQGELPQAFCRCAAVKGCLYQERSHYKGVRLASGQDIFSHQLLMDPSIAIPSFVSSSMSDLKYEEFDGSNSGEASKKKVTKVARGVCITSVSVMADFPNLLIVFPPRSLHAKQLTSVRAIQLSNMLICPPGLCVLYFATLCDSGILGKKSLRAAMKALFGPIVCENSESSLPESHETKPTLLWSAMYIQELAEGVELDDVNSCFMPDGTLHYRELLKSTTKLFKKMFLQEELFPETAADATDDEPVERPE
ncbi:rab escort protein 1 isoform X2 [Aristolochia californica]|uniref:rab escort protein 1 isoform X2 n=1 Tax=Aristolochia californica TaxID=171875 RepID=UPI0035DC9E76